MVREAEASLVNGAGNGHHGTEPSVELVLGNGHANGHCDGAAEPQQSLFSWAEFLAEEPMKPKVRRRKPQPATALFEWAFTLEQSGEAPVGVGR